MPHIQFCRTDIVHIKNGKSYQSRYIQDSERLELGEKIAGLLTPEVYWHEQVQNLDDTQFDNGHLKDMPKSKSVARQLAHELRKNHLKDAKVFKSFDTLQEKIKMRKSKCHVEFMQFLAYSPLLTFACGRKKILTYTTNLEVYRNFYSFYFIRLYEVACQLLCKFLVVRWP